MNKQQAFEEINKIQDEYIDKLIDLINDPNYELMKSINFTSPTGTGKTKMMSKLINKYPAYFFIITTLSKGQLHLQIRRNLMKDCNKENFIVYGSADYKINSKLDADDIINRIPQGVKCIWLRDEGHIRTNRFDEILKDACYKVINFSATNEHSDIQCNFTQTMMLRAVNQTSGSPEDAIVKLIQIKEAHKNIAGYNPCAIFRCVGGDNKLYNRIVDLCVTNGLKYIDITEETFNMSELCEDDNEYDVIINKFKLVEGIDIRRAHVLYMDNQPTNNATTIQVIGRCRRNALLYRDDVDIFAPENEKLLRQTRECFVYYNVEKMSVDADENGELQYAFCNHVSCESLKSGSIIEIENGQLPNGLYVIELKGCSGTYEIGIDDATGFNIVKPITPFYDTSISLYNNYIFFIIGDSYKKIDKKYIPLYPLKSYYCDFDWSIGERRKIDCDPYYDVSDKAVSDIKLEIDSSVICFFDKLKNKYTSDDILSKISEKSIVDIVDDETAIVSYDDPYQFEDDSFYLREYVESYINNNKNDNETSKFCETLSNIYDYAFFYDKEKLLLGKIIHDDNLLLIQYYCIKSITNYDSYHYVYEQLDILATLFYEMDLYGLDLDSLNIKRIISFIFSENTMHNKKIITNKCFRDTLDFYKKFKLDKAVRIELNDVVNYFDGIDKILTNSDFLFLDSQLIIKNVISTLSEIYKDLCNFSTQTTSKTYLEELSEDDIYLINNAYVKCYERLTKKEFDKLPYYQSYEKIENDKESAIVGVDLMQQMRFEDNTIKWFEAKAVTSKITNYNKLNSFLSKKYKEELSKAKSHYFSGKNEFKFNKRCNSIIGYCVEYYSKYLIYGDAYLGQFIEQAQKESHTTLRNEFIIIRACMLKYKYMMIRTFGAIVSKIIKGVSIQQLVQEEYKDFVSLVGELGSRTANYVKRTLYFDRSISNNVDPNLSIHHISGLADYITTDIILDVKVRNYIDEKCVKQVLAYHYLSTKRSDLNIKKVIVYDAVSDKDVVIDISDKNIKKIKGE